MIGRCNERNRSAIDPSMDFSKMRVAKLKAMLAANSVSCQLCVEKDFCKLKDFAASVLSSDEL